MEKRINNKQLQYLQRKNYTKILIIKINKKELVIPKNVIVCFILFFVL